MNSDIIIEIEQADDLDNPMAEMLEAIKEQLIRLAETIKDEAKKALLIIMLSCTMSPVQAVPIGIDAAVDCTEIITANPAEKLNSKLNELSKLEENWDGEGAKAVNKQAIENVRHLIGLLPDNVIAANLRLFPSELGAVSIKMNTDKGTLRSEIGDNIFSYYIRMKGMKKAEHHSFEEWSDSNITVFMSSLLNLV